jgi:heme exporter protein A
VLETLSLACTRGERPLFAGLDLRVPSGTCLHLTGENGAGKTSLLRILCGLLAPAAGEVRWKGADIRELREDYWEAMLYIGHLNGVKDDLTAHENLRAAHAIAGRPAAAADISQALAAFNLAAFEDAQARFLSQGQRRRIALARLFGAAQATLWILDEPYVALDTRGVATLSGLISDHVGRGGIVVLTTHQHLDLPIPVSRLELRGSIRPEAA